MARPPLDLADPPRLTPADKLRLAIEMAEQGIAMKRRSLAREHPDADEEAVDRMLRAWLQEPR